MSPNSSSTCLAGRNARSAALRTISPCPPPVAIGGSANSTPCVPRTPPTVAGRGRASPARRATHRWYRGPIVRGRLVFPVVSRGVGPRRACSRALHALGRARGHAGCSPSALLASGAAAAPARTPTNRRAASGMTSSARASPRLSRSRGRPRSMLTVRNSGTRTVPNVAVTLDSFEYTSNFPELAADKRPIWVDRTGPGDDPIAARGDRGVSPPGGGQTAYVEHLGARPARARQATRTFRWQVVPGEGRACTRPLHRRRRARRQRQAP